MGAQRVGAFDRTSFHAVLEARRVELGISGRELMRQADVHTPSTWPRIVRGAEVSLDTFLRLLAWLGETDVRPYSTLKHEDRGDTRA